MKKLMRFGALTRILSAILLICYLPLSFAGEIYRWVDASGVVNYTQQKPKGVSAQKIVTRNGGPSSVTEVADTVGPAPQPQLTPQQQAMLEKLEATEQARQEEVARIKQDNCTKARGLLDRLTVNQRVRIKGDDGVERTIGEDERQVRIKEAQQGIAVNCSMS